MPARRDPMTRATGAELALLAAALLALAALVPLAAQMEPPARPAAWQMP